jgi:hypothetical protein
LFKIKAHKKTLPAYGWHPKDVFLSVTCLPTGRRGNWTGKRACETPKKTFMEGHDLTHVEQKDLTVSNAIEGGCKAQYSWSVDEQ